MVFPYKETSPIHLPAQPNAWYSAHLMPALNWIEKDIDSQDMARRFNEDEALWQSYQHKRALRRILGSPSPLPQVILDCLDWQEAQRECRTTRAVGLPLPR